MTDALAYGRPLLADGGMATTLFGMGLVPGVPPETWIEGRPEAVAAVHAAFVAAGADIILTNTFGANVARLQPFGLHGRCRALNAAAARLARGVADAAPRPVVVAGSMGPSGGVAAAPDASAAAAAFQAQAEGLADGGVDLLWIETIGTVAEMRAAALAAARVGLRVVVTGSFEAAGRTRGGLTPDAFATAALALNPAPLAIGANCGDGPADLLAILQDLRVPGMPLVAKANAGIPVPQGGGLVHPATPAIMADYARRAADAGAAIVGGCCGTTPTHLAAMRRALDRGGNTLSPTVS